MCGSNLLWYIPPSRHFTKTRYYRVKSLYTGHFTLKFRVKYAMCLKAKMWIPLPPRGGCVWQQIWTTHYRKNMEKYFRNFGKVSQSLNSRENDLYKNSILHLIFGFFYLRNKTSYRFEYVKHKKSKRQTSFLILRVFLWCTRLINKGLGYQNIKD